MKHTHFNSVYIRTINAAAAGSPQGQRWALATLLHSACFFIKYE